MLIFLAACSRLCKLILLIYSTVAAKKSFVIKVLVVDLSFIMKKRREQKLLLIALVLFLLLNVPFVLLYMSPCSVGGLPLSYFMIFLYWLLAIIFSAAVLN